ncbi:hypothetical protein B0J13DRAFT_607279 [Dactylonectria estremocensis]|uniref:Uncharacterized protein n=1 Tax=Dactylonectria estremocensis TaxID=1079267 RepID=A0A9P9EVA4_9HYPO|nr:hypothetical protein B0J13DRAFT_607279 [Dactylonectria estremocensis]
MSIYRSTTTAPTAQTHDNPAMTSGLRASLNNRQRLLGSAVAADKKGRNWVFRPDVLRTQARMVRDGTVLLQQSMHDDSTHWSNTETTERVLSDHWGAAAASTMQSNWICTINAHPSVGATVFSRPMMTPSRPVISSARPVSTSAGLDLTWGQPQTRLTHWEGQWCRQWDSAVGGPVDAWTPPGISRAPATVPFHTLRPVCARWADLGFVSMAVAAAPVTPSS